MRSLLLLLGGSALVLSACGGEVGSRVSTDPREGRALVQVISDASAQSTTVRVDLWSRDDDRVALGDGDELVAIFSDGAERRFSPSEGAFVALRYDTAGGVRVVLRREGVDTLIAAADVPNTSLRVPEAVRFGEPVALRLEPPPSTQSGVVEVKAGASGSCVHLHDNIRFDDKGVASFTAFGDELGQRACAIAFGVQIVGDTGKVETSLSRAEVLWVVRRMAITAAYH